VLVSFTGRCVVAGSRSTLGPLGGNEIQDSVKLAFV
jgi:hypothetical protein